MINKIVLYNLEKRCKELKVEGKDNVAIAAILTNESKKHISNMGVMRFFKKEQCAMQEVASRSDKIQLKKAETRLDTIAQLSYINEETRHILASAKKSRDHKTALLAIQRVEKQLELQAKLLGDIDESPRVVAIREIYINEQQRRD